MSQSPPTNGEDTPNPGRAADNHGEGARPLTDVRQDDPAVAWAMVEASPDALVMVDQSGVIELVNRQTESLFGYDRGELLGRRMEVLLPERFDQVHCDHRARYRVAPRVRAMGTDVDLWARRADGGDFRVEVSLSPVELNGEVHIIAAVRDVSDRVEAARSTHMIQHSIDSVSDAVFVCDEVTLEFIHVNQGAVNLHGYSREELLDSMTPADLAPDLSRADLTSLLESLAGDPDRRARLVTEGRRRDGSRVPVQVDVNWPRPPAPDAARPLVAVVRDISAETAAAARQQQLQSLAAGVSRVRLAMLSGSTRAEGLRLACQSARETLNAVTAMILTPSGDGPALRIEASSGIAEEVRDQLSFAADAGLVGAVCSSGEPMVTDQPHQHPSTPEATHALLDEHRVGSLIVAPLPGDPEVAGVLVVTRSEDDEAFTDADLVPIGQFATGAVAAIELAEAREARSMLELVEDRERIGREMHDKVIGRLFATGMSIQATGARVDDPDIERRLADQVLEIDEAIKDIRTSIYGLRSQLDWGRGIKGEILAVAADHAPALGFEPTVAFSGPVDTLPQSIVDELAVALGEALTDVGQHADAAEVRVSVTVEPGRVELTVAVDGRDMSIDWHLAVG